MGLPRLWALEDSREVIDTFELLLSSAYELRVFETLAAFVAAWTAPDFVPPALLIADLILPDGSFLDLLQSPEWAARPLAPLLVTSGLTDIEPMRKCLGHGALDYIVKPFVGAELLVKVERSLSHGAAAPAADAAVQLDPLTRCVAHNGKVSPPLTSREMQIMTLMRGALAEPIKRGDIIRKVWGNTKVTRKCLDVHLSHLRSKVLTIDLEIKLLDGSAYQLVVKTDRAS